MFRSDYIQEFEAIRAAVEGGRDINELRSGCSMLHNFLDCYYSYQSGSYYDETLDDFVAIEGFISETGMPLEQRPSMVLGHLQWFIKRGSDLNAGDEEFPLMLAVGNLDAHMTDFLISNGANPFWNMDEGIPYDCGNWYVDELDAIALGESFANDADINVFDEVYATALVLAKHGVRDLQTHCVSIDKEGVVSVHKARVLF